MLQTCRYPLLASRLIGWLVQEGKSVLQRVGGTYLERCQLELRVLRELNGLFKVQKQGDLRK